jgi:hypothetical protein
MSVIANERNGRQEGKFLEADEPHNAPIRDKASGAGSWSGLSLLSCMA